MWWRNAWIRCGFWAVSLGLLCLLSWARMDGTSPIQANIITLLPGHTSTQLQDRAAKRSRKAFSQRLLVIVSGEDAHTTRRAALAAQQKMLDAGLKASDTGQALKQVLSVYKKHHFALLTPTQQARLQQGGAKALAADVAVSLFGPAGLVHTSHDPGGYLTKWITSLPRPYPDFLPDGSLLEATRGHHKLFLLQMQLQDAAFGKKGDEQAIHAVDAARASVHDLCPSCQFEATGAALFSHAARLEAQHETVWLSTLSTLLIMVLIAYIFRSLAPHLLGFLQLFSSVIAAAAAVIAVFGSIHIITLVFGTTLLGIAIDYAFLYFSEYWFGHSRPRQVGRKIRAGLGMGLLTGTLAFAFMLPTGFPALAQMAVFSIVGLLEAACVVWLVFPVALHKAPAVPFHRAVGWPARFITAACRPTRWRYILPLLLLALSIPGWFMLQARDDVRELSHLDAQQLHIDQQVHARLHSFSAPGFFLVKADNIEQALERESTLFTRLGKAMPEVEPIGLSRFIPPKKRQLASLATWKALLQNKPRLHQAFTQMGLPPALADRMIQQWQQSPAKVLDASSLLQAASELKQFVVTLPDKKVAIFSTAVAPENLDQYDFTAMTSPLTGVQYVQPLVHINQTFSHIRVRASWLVVLGYLFISGLLIWRYGYREALRMLYPPLLALGITLGAMGWLGEPVNVFVVVALILILGLGRDYAIFLREMGAREHAAALAVTLSAMTTICSFGLLSLSKIPALHAFGLAALIGIIASYLVAPLSLPPTHDHRDHTP